MQDTDLPAKFPVPFAVNSNSADIRQIPLTTTDPKAASLDAGFSTTAFTPIGAGGAPPDGRDFQGLFNQISAWCRWQAAGGGVKFDPTFQSDASGYPKGAVIESAVAEAFGQRYISTANGNLTNPDAGGAGWSKLRWRLTQNLTLYVSPTGSDSNNGLTAGTAFLTMNRAWNFIQTSLDGGGFTVTVFVANGVAGGLAASGPTVGFVPSTIVFDGGGVATINAGGGNCFSADNGAQLTVVNFTLLGAIGLFSQFGGNLQFGNLNFGACSIAHIEPVNGGTISANTGYTISGGSTCHWLAQQGGFLKVQQLPITLIGTPAFSSAFASVSGLSNVVCSLNTFTGPATGNRFIVSSNSLINTFGAATTYLPGSIAGIEQTGGRYV